MQTADAAAASLAALSALLAASCLSPLASGRRSTAAWPVLLLVASLAVMGVMTSGTHRHVATGHEHELSEGSAHSTAAVREPAPYDPTKPVDLGGMPGVTPEQQAAAENLVAVTVSRLPQWADAAKAEGVGFRSIGDGFTGTEHLISEAFLHDNVILDPDRPESLVYDTSQGGRRLVAAMYMLAPGTRLDDVPDVGGALVQWHTHDDLCFTRSGRVAGITRPDGTCGAGLMKPLTSPMVHVWITPHRCGPFAALEGIAGGRIADGRRGCATTPTDREGRHESSPRLAVRHRHRRPGTALSGRDLTDAGMPSANAIIGWHFGHSPGSTPASGPGQTCSATRV